MDNNKKSYQLLVLIATPKLADRATEFFRDSSLPVQYRWNAEGTASSDIMDLLGFGSIDKCVMAIPMPSDMGKKMLYKLHSDLRLDTANSGIAFTLSLTGASNLIIRMLGIEELQSSSDMGGKDRYIMPDIKYSLVCAVVNRGFSGDVMKAAKAAGASGGTVVHSRSIVNDDVLPFKGLGDSDEKEIVLIITDSEAKMSIMSAISENCGVSSEAKGVVMSLPLDAVMGV